MTMTVHDETAHSSEEEEQLWIELEKCASIESDDHEAIDDCLRTWLDLTVQLREQSNDPQEEVATSAQILLEGPVYQSNKEYVRKQIIHSLLQEDETAPLHAIASLILLDGHHDDSIFSRMVTEACFSRLLELINGRRGDDPLLHRLLLHLMYEMSRIERLRLEDLLLVDDDFIRYLFGIIEVVSDDVHDPYHYPTIRVLLVLNEQYMLASTDPIPELDNTPITNRIVKCLSYHGPLFRTFGENIILLLNRETETSLQLLILKLLYLLFTNKATYEYFYTNDLRVLLDVIIRNLMDLPDEKMSLRHTYLRVLHPLLAHTTLSQAPYYKQEEILRVLQILRGSQNVHFAPADETSLRLVDRVSKVRWLLNSLPGSEGSGEAEVARKLLGISLSPTQTQSSVSIVDIAAVMEKPGVQTPSRIVSQSNTDVGIGNGKARPADEGTPTGRAEKPLPTVPRHRYGVPFSEEAKAILSVSDEVPTKKVPPKAPPPRRWGRSKVIEQSPVEVTPDTLVEQEAQ